MDIPNTAQATSWNGPEGVHWADQKDHTAGGNAALHRLLFGAAAITETDRVLDIGCGAGETTIVAARLAARGHVVGVDLSRPMLERARADGVRSGLVNLRFEEGDAQVHPFPDDHFDVAVSQFGIMFFADPVAAFANIGRAVRPGGRLVFVCPQDIARCAWYTVPNAALLGHPPEPPADALAPGMFSLADRSRIERVLGEAGFRTVTTTAVDVPLYFGRDAANAADFYLGTGPVRAILERDATLTPAAARAILRATLEPYAGPEGVYLGGALWLVSAER
ncbi:class I SAM-dependent methyltransferase [Herbidospora yilanensis]|uniref:class I SAM-dependent methyltransferase n=1 Tax=Herbidospora yilanensis TaxID=354426 RepID=UPI000781C14F|nr:class I SAM-dependent methyltransferase [Herbidospora yilanensis]